MVSVIIPVNKNKVYLERSKLVVKSLENISKGDIETLISNVNKCTPNFNPGVLRNIEAKRATNEILYFSDADMMLKDRVMLDYTIDAIHKDKYVAFTKPLIRRLPLCDFQNFSNLVNQKGMDYALNLLNYSYEHQASLSDEKKIYIYRKKDETFLTSNEELEKFLEKDNKGQEPFFWTMNRSFGTLIISKDFFEKVGGYSLEYKGWGLEDDDILWKISKYGTYDEEITIVNFNISYFSDYPAPPLLNIEGTGKYSETNSNLGSCSGHRAHI